MPENTVEVDEKKQEQLNISFLDIKNLANQKDSKALEALGDRYNLHNKPINAFICFFEAASKGLLTSRTKWESFCSYSRIKSLTALNGIYISSNVVDILETPLGVSLTGTNLTVPLPTQEFQQNPNQTILVQTPLIQLEPFHILKNIEAETLQEVYNDIRQLN